MSSTRRDFMTQLSKAAALSGAMALSLSGDTRRQKGEEVLLFGMSASLNASP